MNLNEFFIHKMNEAPRKSKPLYTAPEEVPVKDNPDAAGADLGDDMGDVSPGMTQNTKPLDPSQFVEFANSVKNAMGNYSEQMQGVDMTNLEMFATSLDKMASDQYRPIQGAQQKGDYHTNYRKVAADWSKDLGKLFQKLLSLQGGTNL